MTPETEAKPHKLRWLHVYEGRKGLEEAELGNGLKYGEFGIIKISTTCDDPSDPDSNHDYGYSKGLDFDAAVKAYESGKKGKWDTWHGHTPGGVEVELLLEEWDADKAATISMSITMLTLCSR